MWVCAIPRHGRKAHGSQDQVRLGTRINSSDAFFLRTSPSILIVSLCFRCFWLKIDDFSPYELQMFLSQLLQLACKLAFSLKIVYFESDTPWVGKLMVLPSQGWVLCFTFTLIASFCACFFDSGAKGAVACRFVLWAAWWKRLGMEAGQVWIEVWTFGDVMVYRVAMTIV